MQVSPWIRLPVPQKLSSAMLPGDNVPSAVIQAVTFELKHGPDKYDLFFECSVKNGCFGCGCPPFSIECKEIPQEILDHLTTHVEMCSGLKRV
jgi:hypothetical protein